MSELNRRQLIRAAGRAACACAACPLLTLLADEAHGAEAAGEVACGAVEEYARDGIYNPAGKRGAFFLVSRKGRLYAVSSTCTHKRVKLKAGKGGFKCPRHGSLFDLSGKATKAPARKPLPRYPIRLDDATRRVMVDMSRALKPSQWNAPVGFIELAPG